MKRWYFLPLALLLTLTGFAQSQPRPNIVYILADDLGIGDVSVYNRAGKIKTPNIDGLARTGVRFTDAHTSSAVCTPTRYGILTGRYNWRSRLKSSVLNGYDQALVAPQRETVAAFLKKQGYQTGVIGKWHLGWNWAASPAGSAQVDFTKPVAQSPNAYGFDYSFCIAASLDMAPYVYVENGRSTSIPVDSCPARTGVAFYRAGIIAPDFRHEEVLPKFTEKAIGFINQQAGKDAPFFLYFPLPAPHTPVLPMAAYQGGITPYADFVGMVDDVVGQVIKALKAKGIYDNTLVIFASDNGFAPAADLPAQLAQGHDPSMRFRGTKADIFEGGHRVPFLVSWPRTIQQGRTSSRLVCTTDLFRTLAELNGTALPDNTAEDSYSFLTELTGRPSELPPREAVVHHSIDGSFAIRRGNWKLIWCSGSGGWSAPRPASEEAKKLPPLQLYDLAADPGETRNVYESHPAVVKELTEVLTQYVQNGRSTPGTRQANDGPAHWPQLNWIVEAK